MSERKTILITVSSVIVVILVVFTLFGIINKGIQPPTTSSKAPADFPLPSKTDFGTTTKPTDFPTDIPTEKGATIEQSFSLDYPGQKQLSIVFRSTKTVKENYTLYADFLKKNNWNIVNKYESENLSSLYATKESNDINVTVSANASTSTKSQVSVSVLKK